MHVRNARGSYEMFSFAARERLTLSDVSKPLFLQLKFSRNALSLRYSHVAGGRNEGNATGSHFLLVFTNANPSTGLVTRIVIGPYKSFSLPYLPGIVHVTSFVYKYVEVYS